MSKKEIAFMVLFVVVIFVLLISILIDDLNLDKRHVIIYQNSTEMKEKLNYALEYHSIEKTFYSERKGYFWFMRGGYECVLFTEDFEKAYEKKKADEYLRLYSDKIIKKGKLKMFFDNIVNFRNREVIEK